jgi:hypothetical protein
MFDQFLQPENNNQKLILNSSTIKNHFLFRDRDIPGPIKNHLICVGFITVFLESKEFQLNWQLLLFLIRKESPISILIGINKNKIYMYNTFSKRIYVVVYGKMPSPYG